MRDVSGINGYHEWRMQHYESLVRETQKQQLLNELGVTEIGILRSAAADFRGWLSRVVSKKVNRSRYTAIRVVTNEANG